MRLLISLAAACVGWCSAQATSVRPPTFAELVDGSALVFRGHVTAVETIYTGDGADRHLATRVTFAVERPLKGDVPPALTLEFMGGELGRRRLLVDGLPRFTVGDRGVFFVENRDNVFCPLTRLRHGRYRIVDDAQHTERVLRDDESALPEARGVHQPLDETAGPAVATASIAGSAMALADFEAAVTRHARQSAAKTAP